MQNQPSTPARQAEITRSARRDIVRAVEAARPVDDLLGWLLARYPDASREWIFAALKTVYDSDFSIDPASPQPRTYRIGREELEACPQRVA